MTRSPAPIGTGAVVATNRRKLWALLIAQVIGAAGWGLFVAAVLIGADDDRIGLSNLLAMLSFFSIPLSLAVLVKATRSESPLYAFFQANSVAIGVGIFAAIVFGAPTTVGAATFVFGGAIALGDPERYRKGRLVAAVITTGYAMALLYVAPVVAIGVPFAATFIPLGVADRLVDRRDARLAAGSA